MPYTQTLAEAPVAVLAPGAEERRSRRKLIEALALQGTSGAPIEHWTQGLNRIAQAGLAGVEEGRLRKDEQSQEARIAAALAGLPGLGGGTPSTTPEPPLPPPTAGPRSASMPPVETLPPEQPSPYKVAGMPAPTNSQDTFRTPLDAMAPREQGLAALSTAMGGKPPMSGMNPAGATPVQTQAIRPPAPMQQAQAASIPARPQTQIDPASAQYIKTLLANPQTRAIGMQLYQAANKPRSYDKLNDDTLYEKSTGETKSVGPGYRPLVDPAERKAHGIPDEDKRPYQLGPAGKLINPPPETRVSIDQRAESKFREKAGGLTADRFNDYVKAGDDARGMVADLDSLREIGSRVNTGKVAEVVASLGPYAEALGVKIDGLGDLQAYNAIVAKMAPRMRAPGSGATSDFEMRQYLSALPSLGKTEEGNAIVANTNQALLAHRQAVSEIASRAMAEEITPRDAEKMIRELPDPMAMWKKSRGSSPAAPVSKDGWSIKRID